MLNEDQKKELFGLYEEFPMKSKGTLIMNIEEIFSVSSGPDAGKQLRNIQKFPSTAG